MIVRWQTALLGALMNMAIGASAGRRAIECDRMEQADRYDAAIG